MEADGQEVAAEQACDAARDALRDVLGPEADSTLGCRCVGDGDGQEVEATSFSDASRDASRDVGTSAGSVCAFAHLDLVVTAALARGVEEEMALVRRFFAATAFALRFWTVGLGM